MSDAAPTICFHCGLSAGDPPRLNRLENGAVCQACSDRLLATLPPVLPAFDPANETVVNEYEQEAGDLGYGSDYDEPA